GRPGERAAAGPGGAVAGSTFHDGCDRTVHQAAGKEEVIARSKKHSAFRSVLFTTSPGIAFRSRSLPELRACRTAHLQPCMAEAGNTTTPRATFTKEERLCGRLRLKEVVSTGRTVHESPIKLVGKKMALPTMQPAQVAFAIPRRYMRNAVDRNKM